MSLHWSRSLGWRPQGGRECDWKDLQPCDLIALDDRKVWRIIEVRPVPLADWDANDRKYRDSRFGGSAARLEAIRRIRPDSEETWDRRPLYLILVPESGGKRHHLRIRPYATWRGAWVLSPHYPVCKDCGEPWPCRELDITEEVEREAAKMERMEKILPGCCWSCGEPVTHKQTAIRFDGDNLLLPGAASPVFHLRRRGDCRSAAASYEKRWVTAEEGRRWRLQCPGKLVRHVDGDECTEDPHCPGGNAHHGTYTSHAYGRLPDGSVRSVYGPDLRCCRCEDALGRQNLSLGDPLDGALL